METPLNKIIKLIHEFPIDGISTRIKHNPELFSAVSEIVHGKTIMEKTYCYVNDIRTAPLCNCGQQLKFIGYNMGYREFCSSSCNYAKLAATERRVSTMIANGGVGLANLKSKHKAQSTNINRYGVANTFCLPKVDDFRKNNNPMHNTETVEKIREACLEDYGVDWHSKREEVRAAQRATSFEKYGVPNHAQSHYTENTLEILSSYDSMKELYESKSINEIATHLEVSETTVLKYLKFLGIRMPNEITPEIQIKNWLHELGFTDFVKTRKILPKNTELDLYSESKKIAIEHCGLYWHSQKWKHRKYHQEKYAMCKERNIRLVTIFEDEWIRNQQIVKSRLMHILGCSAKGKPARKLTVKRISNIQAKEFFDKHHMSGHTGATDFFGAFDNDIICSAMSFSKNRKITKKNNTEWEMVRFATDGETHTGIAAKLFSLFVKENNPTSVLSFSDLRWGEGDYLKHLGFSRLVDTSPGYWYFSLNNLNYIRYHRYRFNKKQLMEKTMNNDITWSEYRLAKSLYLERIWDCGNAVWVWQKPNKLFPDIPY